MWNMMRVFLLTAVFAAPLAALSPDRAPYTLRDDFETGELAAWECYPYAQDIGYDPATLCQREPAHNGSKYAIARIVKPNDMIDLAEGFTKRIDLWTVPATRMKCAIFLTADRKPATLVLSLCLFDGGRYFHTVKSTAVNRWIELDIPLASFTSGGKPLAAGAHVQAVTVKASYPLVTHLASYTISMDDFSLNGDRQRRFRAESPKSVDFEMFGFSILARHFYRGDRVGVTVRPEPGPGRGPLVSVAADVLDGDGKTLAAGVPLKGAGGAWSSDALYTIGQSDARGQWTVNLSGKDAAGNEVKWGFRFLMPGDRLTPKDHPRLHFTAAGLAERLSKQSPIEKKILDGSVTGPDYFKKVDISGMNEAKNLSSESLTGGPYSVVSTAYDNWRGPQSGLAGVIEAGSWRFLITGDREAGLKAKEALLKLSSFSHWNHPWQDAHHNWTYFPMGYTIGPVAMGFDALYPLMTADEKRLVREALMDKGIKPFYRDMVEMNRMPSSLSNHIAVLVANLAMAATAIYGEDPANPSLEPWMSGILAKMKQFIDRTYYPDGGYGEPVTYQDMATRDLVEALDVLERNFGIDYTTTTHLQDSWKYPLQATFTNGRYPDFGDVSPAYGFTGPTFMWFAHRTKNPYAFDFVRKSLEAGRGGMLGWLWYTEGIPSKPRTELPPSKFFPIKGNMVMRSGWEDDGSVLVFRCGPNSNHYHVDQGSFQIFTNGEELLSDAGHGSSYYANLYYPCYYTQPVGHNVMLVDGNAESQEPADYENGIVALRDYPRIKSAFAGTSADDAEGDLACVYKGTLASYTRTLLYLKPDVLVLLDRVRGNGPHDYRWLFHAEHTDGKSPIAWSGNRMTITRPKARLTMDVLSPVIASNRIANSDRDESFLSLVGAPDTRDADFLAVLSPRALKGSGDAAPAIASTSVRADGWIGARVKGAAAGTEAVAMFRETGKSGPSTAEGFTADADRFAAVYGSDGTVRRVFMRGISLSKPGEAELRASRPVAVSVTFGGSAGTTIEIEADTPADVTVGPVASMPVKISEDGQSSMILKWDAVSKTIGFTVPKGHSIVTVK